MTTYKGSGLPDNVDPDISTWTPEMFLLDEIGEVEKPSGEDAHRWGVAVPNAERPGPPLVWQREGQGRWHFAATGWEVPR